MLGAPVAERHLDLWLVAEAVAGFECSGDQLHVVGAARVGVRDASDVVGGDVEDGRGGEGAIMESAGAVRAAAADVVGSSWNCSASQRTPVAMSHVADVGCTGAIADGDVVGRVS